LGTAEETLNKVLEIEKGKIKTSYPSKDVIFVLIEIIRSLDYHAFMLAHDIDVPDKELLLEKYDFGWSQPFSIFYNVFELTDNVPLFKFSYNEKKWIDILIQRSGSIGLCKQFLDYCKADLFDLKNEGDNFTFYNLFENSGIEYYERLSLAHYHSVMDGILTSRSKAVFNRLPEMREKLKSIVTVSNEDFITYRATPEIDEFYSSFGYLYLMTTQVIDDFAENDSFGGINYKDYLDCLQQLFKSAIMHRDCCMALAEKTSHKIFLRNILTHCFSINKYVKNFSDYMDWDEERTKEVISAFTLNKENINFHLSNPKANPPPFIQLGKNTIMESSHGSLKMPIFFLNRELKRKYPKDYFNAVNNREIRFREQLYSLFPEGKVIKVNGSRNIRAESLITDVDAILFDIEAKSLGLFQLKWQDTFASSMRERFSRINNLIPKSVEWIERILTWISKNDSKSIFKTLGIDTDVDSIDNVYIFIISRNHAHFSNQKLDDRAIWASWYQLVEAFTKVKPQNNTDSIATLAVGLKFFDPEVRMKREALPKLKDYEFTISKYKIQVKSHIK
jgi:hypothetical protein